MENLHLPYEPINVVDGVVGIAACSRHYSANEAAFVRAMYVLVLWWPRTNGMQKTCAVALDLKRNNIFKTCPQLTFKCYGFGWTSTVDSCLLGSCATNVIVVLVV